MSTKLDLLEIIRLNKPEEIPLPDSSCCNPITDNEKLLAIFTESLLQAGAEVLDEFPVQEIVDFRRSEVWEEYSTDCSLAKLYALETILLSGRFGVAENGAIWLDEEDFPNRLLPFVAQQLIIRLDKTQIVSDMHEAYRLIAQGDTGFGVFVSGPSKTADIEQHLVHGAQGAKTLTVVLE